MEEPALAVDCYQTTWFCWWRQIFRYFCVWFICTYITSISACYQDYFVKSPTIYQHIFCAWVCVWVWCRTFALLLFLSKHVKGMSNNHFLPPFFIRGFVCVCVCVCFFVANWFSFMGDLWQICVLDSIDVWILFLFFAVLVQEWHMMQVLLCIQPKLAKLILTILPFVLL